MHAMIIKGQKDTSVRLMGYNYAFMFMFIPTSPKLLSSIMHVVLPPGGLITIHKNYLELVSPSLVSVRG